MQGRENEFKLCRRNSIRPEDSEAWPKPAHANEQIFGSWRIRQSTPFAQLIVTFAGLLLLSSQLAYAIFPWPVRSTTAETAAYVVWRTDVAGSSQVNYGATPAYGSRTTLDRTLVTYHAQTITGLTAGSTYHFQVVSKDANNNTVTSHDYTFTTLAAPTGTVKTVKPSGGNYTTIHACIAAASPGWTCEVYAKSGGYDENVSVSVSGTSGSPIIVEAHDAVVTAAFTFSANVSYVTIEGFEISTSAFTDFQSCASTVNAFLTTTNSHLVIASNYVHNVYAGNLARDSSYGHKSNYLQFLSNIMTFVTITNTNPPYTHPCNSSHNGATYSGINTYGDHNLYDGNYFSEIDHISYASGQYNIWRRNVMSHSYAADWGADPTVDHVDYFHPASTTASGGAHMDHNILENNQEYDADDSNQHFYLASGCNDQSAASLGPGDGQAKTFSGTLSLTNANGTDTAIATFSVAIVVNVSNLGCGSSQYSAATVAAVDDGFGHLVNYPGGSGVSSGTINYSNGAFSVTFSSAPPSGVSITAYWSLLNLSSHDMIVRYNTGYYLGEAFVGPSLGGTPGMRVYNNTIYHSGYEGTLNNYGTAADNYTGLSDANPHWADLNNLFYDALDYSGVQPPWSVFSVLSPPAVTPGYALVYNSACAPSCSYNSATTSAPGMVLNQNPNYTNVPAYDFTLASGSPAINAGTYLTTVASNDSGSGMSLIVSDAGFFQDGYGISGVIRDCISVTTVTNHVCITAINYQTNTLTLASSITRSVSDPVWLYSDSTGRQVLFGKAPNIGATFATGKPSAPTGLTANVQ